MPWAVPSCVEPSGFAFWRCWQWSFVITWIGREHELYSGISPISLVEHCVTFRHDRRLLSLLGFVHNWPTRRWSATKKENRFSLNGNRIMSSFLGRQFYRSTLCVCVCVCVCAYIYIYTHTHTHTHTRTRMHAYIHQVMLIAQFPLTILSSIPIGHHIWYANQSHHRANESKILLVGQQ